MQGCQYPLPKIPQLNLGEAGRGLAFAWNTIRDCDMVTIGTTTPDEARESIDISLDLPNRRIPDNELQKTRSKNSLKNTLG
jgi:hypothetical protein